jgi:hypothetical protein
VACGRSAPVERVQKKKRRTTTYRSFACSEKKKSASASFESNFKTCTTKWCDDISASFLRTMSSRDDTRRYSNLTPMANLSLIYHFNQLGIKCYSRYCNKSSIEDKKQAVERVHAGPGRRSPRTHACSTCVGQEPGRKPTRACGVGLAWDSPVPS